MVSWLSFVEFVDIGMVFKGYVCYCLFGMEFFVMLVSGVVSELVFELVFDMVGEMVGEIVLIGDFFCINLLIGMVGGVVEVKVNFGMLVFDVEFKIGMLILGMVFVYCGLGGFLLIGELFEFGFYVLLGNNYYVYDILLFWVNLCVDVVWCEGVWKC